MRKFFRLTLKWLTVFPIILLFTGSLALQAASEPAPNQKLADLKIDLNPPLNPALQAVDADLRDAIQTLEKKFVDSGVVYEDPALTAYVNHLLTPADLGVPESQFKFNIKILKLPDENAFAFPSGNIYLNAGLIPLTKNADELRFILAHEAMHVLGKHIVFHQKSTRDQTTVIKLLDIVITPAASIANVYTDFQYSNFITGIADLTGTAAGLFYVASVQGYGRAMEVEADHFGCRVMNNMGKDMAAPVSFFNTFKQFHAKYVGMEFTHFASSHESSADRAKRAESFMPEGKKASDLSEDRAYMDATRDIRLDVAELNIKLGRVHRAIDALTLMEPIYPDNARIQYLLGEAYRRLEEDVFLSKRELVRKEWLIVCKEGEKKMKEEWKSKLLEHFNKSIQLNESFAPTHRGLALYYESIEDWAKSQASYEAYLKYEPQASDQRFIKAKIKLMASKQAEAVKATTEAVQEKRKG